MGDAAPVDEVASEWADGFDRTFAVADELLEDSGPVLDRASTAFLDQLATHPDTHVAKRHGRAVAEQVRDRARSIRSGDGDVERFADDLVAEAINPGTTADVLAAGLFVALQRGLAV